MQVPQKYLLLTIKKNNEKIVQLLWGFFWGGLAREEEQPEISNS
jgi:hypothetical protein